MRKKPKQFDEYAAYYDFLYQNKNYRKECDFIDKAIRTFGPTQSKHILSVGCGTCAHELILEKKGYHVTGIDTSAAMLCVARQKIQKRESKIQTKQVGIASFKSGRKFAAVIAPFNVIGYQHSIEDFDAFFKNSSRCLRKGGLLLFDTWQASAVLLDPPQNKHISFPHQDGKTILRKTRAQLHMERSVVDITFDIFVKDRKKKTLHITTERHPMRFFTPMELHYAAFVHGLQIVAITSSMSPVGKLDPTQWNIWVIAKKIR